MLQLNPSAVFQRTQKELAAEHQGDVRASKMSVLLSFALAAMAGRTAVTNENLTGARMFIDIFLNLAETPDAAKPSMPQKDIRTDAERLAAIKDYEKKKTESK